MPNSKDFNHFDYNPTDIHIERSMFNLDHSVKFSANVGECIPFDVIECLPGDTFSVHTSKVIRLQPLVTPIMDEVICDVYWFFVPNRLVWNHWKNFCGENNSSPWAPETTYSIPHLTAPEGGWNVGTIADYMGIPPKKKHSCIVNALPFRAYALICDQWFRSEAIMNPVQVSVNDTLMTGSNGDNQVTDIQKGGKPFIACRFPDYFSTALPSPQRGNAASVFPDNTFAPVVSRDINGHPYSSGKSFISGLTDESNFVPIKFTYNNSDTMSNASGPAALVNDNGLSSSTGPYTGTDIKLYPSNLWTIMSDVSFNINDLRSAFAVQRYLEKSARFGGRYTEFIKGFFGIDSPDARLQRTEYLGGSRISLNINSVEQTSATESGTTPQGNVAGMSVTADRNDEFTYSCTEHGYIIGISVLRYFHSYQQGLNRLWLRDNFEEFYLPTFAFLGEQPVYKEELWLDAETTEENVGDRKKVVFGYQERWAEYRYQPNRVAGEMRSIASDSLDVWHLADNYSSMPTLSPEWIREDKSMLDRCLAVTSAVSNQAIFDFYIKVQAARPLPLYSIPGMIDHY